MNEILFRTKGVGRGKPYLIDRAWTLRANFSFEFSSANKLIILLILVLAISALLFALCKWHRVHISWKFIGLMIALALLPYAWYLALANHSQIHFWFTYREQFVSVFAFFTVVALFFRENFLERG